MLPHKESIVNYLGSLALRLLGPGSAPEERAGYGALLCISVTPFQFCQPRVHLTPMEGRNIMVSGKGARSSFPQDGRKMSMREANGMELEEKRDCR